MTVLSAKTNDDGSAYVVAIPATFLEVFNYIKSSYICVVIYAKTLF